ncbi:DUF427 domain-containing protein [Paralimibaculum aggregatum]|uniref:DUF427 domain-containing protein n=1 Tax=Paralimibaculum aggregatum TaxID=3036245 RepID=A0ABQ6LPW5_9RHOB|nr:DUF427 domain-containing protein [Limibaculum sp. NKW23]GMG84671.1 DUF427 domain-containing protein [Limibaculum sp. NKW23]
MSDQFTIEPAPGIHVVRAGGAVIAETSSALVLKEKGYEPVIYFPRADIGMAFLDSSETRTTCPHKGEASYYHIEAKSGRIEDAGWSYEDPLAGAEAIRGHIAFAHERVAVERV